MNQEFLDLYDRELKVLYEQAAEFADEYPGIAERLGGLVRERVDPMVAGLLEGAAFLAARVQLKIKHEFPEFTENLLDQLVPHYLSPTPSALLAQVRPTFGDPALRDGLRIPRGASLEATHRDRERRTACRFRLCHDVALWPFDLVGAEYLPTIGSLQALGVTHGPEAIAGLRLTLTHRTAARIEDEMSDAAAATVPETWFAGCRTKDLTVHLMGAESDAIALYEQIFGDCVGLCFRHLDSYGDPVITPFPVANLAQIGFGDDEGLLPTDPRVFHGFDLLREYFLFPRKFLGFRLDGLGAVLPKLTAKTVDVIFLFDEANPRLPGAVNPSVFALYGATAINLFEMATDRIPVRTNQHEFQVVPDRSHPLDYEPHRILDVHAHFHGGRDKVPVAPLYAGALRAETGRSLFYSTRRLPRRRSQQERASGGASDYTGTELFISLIEPAGIDSEAGVAELSVRALCSNRHLPEQLPVGEGGSDFRLIDHMSLDVTCRAGPTKPREPVVAQQRGRSEVLSTGAATWRLISILSTNQLGLVEHGGGARAEAVRETLSLFADSSDSATERRVRGVRKVDSRPVVRRLRHRMGLGAARGIEVTVTLDERAFEGSGAFLLGAILDRYFAEYAAMNHFTETVVRTTERGEIMRWPPRAGTRGPL